MTHNKAIPNKHRRLILKDPNDVTILTIPSLCVNISKKTHGPWKYMKITSDLSPLLFYDSCLPFLFVSLSQSCWIQEAKHSKIFFRTFLCWSDGNCHQDSGMCCRWCHHKLLYLEKIQGQPYWELVHHSFLKLFCAVFFAIGKCHQGRHSSCIMLIAVYWVQEIGSILKHSKHLRMYMYLLWNYRELNI